MSARVSRRTFLKLSAAGAASAVLLGSRAPALRALEVDTGQSVAPPKVEYKPGVCLQCPGGTGLLAKVVDGTRVVKVEGNPYHSQSKGKLCPKGMNAVQVLYDPDRIKGPMKNVGGRGPGKAQWKPITWEEAISEVSAKLKAIREKKTEREGPHNIMFMAGRLRPRLTGEIYGRWATALGTPNTIGHSNICSDGAIIGHYITDGYKHYNGYDWENCNYAILFGAQILDAARPTLHVLRSYGYMRRGERARAKIVYVGTKMTATGAKADEIIYIKPGTDGALALGIANVMIKEGLYDREFVEKQCRGFEEWRDKVVAKYTPEQVEKITEVPASKIVEIARGFGGAAPHAIAYSQRGSMMHTNGVLNHACVHALNALAGSIDAKGGVLYQDGLTYAYPLPGVSLDDYAKHGLAQPRIDLVGTWKFPIAKNAMHLVPERILAEEPYPIKAIFFWYTDPLYSHLQRKRWEKAYLHRSVELMVSLSPFYSETCDYCDYILPEPTYLERWHDEGIYPAVGFPVIGLRQPVIKPVFDTKNAVETLTAIARRIGGSVAESFPSPVFDSAENIIKYAYENGVLPKLDPPVSWEEFKKRGALAASPDPSTFDAKTGSFKRYITTPGKNESYAYGWWRATRMAQRGAVFDFKMEKIEELVKGTRKGVHPYKEAEFKSFWTAKGEDYALIHYEEPKFFGSGDLRLDTYKLMVQAEGRGANQPWLIELYGTPAGVHSWLSPWECFVEIHPEDAAVRGIKHGDRVRITTDIGSIETTANVTYGVRKGSVAVPHGLGRQQYGRWAQGRGVTVNDINISRDAPDIDQLAAQCQYFSTMCRVEKVR